MNRKRALKVGSAHPHWQPKEFQSKALLNIFPVRNDEMVFAIVNRPWRTRDPISNDM